MKDPTEYPKQMFHPAYQRGSAKAVIGTDPTSGRQFTDYQGTPDRFPPVAVANLDEEAQYRAKGYLPFGETAVNAVSYQEYPKMLTHPKHEPATPTFAAVTNSAGQVTSAEIPGKPAKFSPLTVNDEDEESAAVAKGYTPPGKCDPDAVQASISSPHDPTRVTQEYPKVVNGVVVNDPAVDPSGFQEYPKWVGDKLVNSRAEEVALTGAKPAEPKPATTPQPSPDAAAAADRQALFAEAERRGIQFKKQWSTATLRKALEQQAA